ncbi:MAG: hypothetical protein LBT98_03475 [Puniceicoccales bacterium]|jgi:hypothetical protein|nr:hypothetical protein [Puniceicoccales bacterium]
MTTTNNDQLLLVDDEELRTPGAGSFALGYVNGELWQKDDQGFSLKILTEDSMEGYVPSTRTVNGMPLSADVTFTTDNIQQGTSNLYNVQADFAEVDPAEASFIKNKQSLQDGHVILDPDGTALEQRSKLQFQGAAIESVTDDGANDVTIVTIAGGDDPGMANPMTAKGDIIVGVDASGSPGKLSIGAAGQVLTVDSAGDELSWKTPFSNPMSAVGDLIVGGTNGTPTRLAADSAGKVLSVTSSGTIGWTTPFANPMSSAGDLIVGGTDGLATRLPIGEPGSTLRVLAAGTLGWATELEDRNLWPGNELFSSSTYVAEPYFVVDSFVTALDGWVIYRPSSAAVTNTTFTATPILTSYANGFNDATLNRKSGDKSVATYYINRPFSWRETAPLVGKTVTFSFGLKLGAGLLSAISSNGIHVRVTGTAGENSQLNIGYDGSFGDSNQVLATMPVISSGSSTSFLRQSLTFEVPSDIQQICICISHTPAASTSSTTYTFALRLPAVRIGLESGEPNIPQFASNYIANGLRFQRVLASANGSVVQDEITERFFPFPIPMETSGNILCVRAIDAVTPSGYGPAAITQVTSVTPRGFTVARSAASISDRAGYATWYHFGELLWPFDAVIPNF